MKNLKLYLVSLSVVLFTFGCSDFLEPGIKTEIEIENFGKTPDETDFLLTQAYSEMRNDAFLGSVYWAWFPSDYSIGNPGTTIQRSGIGRMEHDATDGESILLWRACYNVIAKANLVIEKTTTGLGLAGNTETQKAQWNRIEGEARFIRSLAYMQLATLYRNVPIITEFFKDFEKIFDISNAPADKMREQEIKVYEFVVNDLKKATEQLPTSSVRGRINKISASAFLGKAYLLMASIEKHREQAGSGETFYTSALEALNTVINSNAYSLKTYFPDNFILDKQYSGGNELIFTIEFNAADKNNFNIFGVNSGFFNNSGAPNTVFTGSLATANGGSFPNDWGLSAFDLDSPGDWVRRFWSFEDGEFRSYNVNTAAGFQNGPSDCLNGQGINCEIFLRSSEPYPWCRPYWFELVNDNNAFRNNPAATDIVTVGSVRSFSIIWGGGGPTTVPNIKLTKFRRNPITQAGYTDATFEGDWPIMRYAEVLLMYAEVANELAGPAVKPANGKFTALEAVNLIRNRARNFVYYDGLTPATRILPNSPYTATYQQVFEREAKVGRTPAPLKNQNAADTLKKYYFQISAFRGIREVPANPVIRNFKDFPETKDWIPDFAASLNASSFRDALLDERWRELAGEQNSRWLDLNRHGRLIKNISEIKTKINPLTKRSLESTVFGTRVLPIPDNKYTYLAIPANELVRNPKLNQNAGF
jgi:hypothetical protein